MVDTHLSTSKNSGVFEKKKKWCPPPSRTFTVGTRSGPRISEGPVLGPHPSKLRGVGLLGPAEASAGGQGEERVEEGPRLWCLEAAGHAGERECGVSVTRVEGSGPV